MKIRIFASLVVLAAAAAHGDELWSRPHHPPSGARDLAMAEGNTQLNDAQSVAYNAPLGRKVPPQVLEHARAALAAYERAAEISEDVNAHVHALAAATLIDERWGLCADCRDGYQAVIRHVEAIRRLDPMTPKELDLSGQMAWALSKLAGLGGANADAYFERAIAEYDHGHHLIDEAGTPALFVASRYGNQAELYMAVGNLEEAIRGYRRAVELDSTEALHHYGLAVALDRDGQWDKAVTSMRQALQYDRNMAKLAAPRDNNQRVFFTPEGELFYYVALAHQVLGDDLNLAITNYNRYLTLAKTSKYHARAQEHLDELTKAPSK